MRLVGQRFPELVVSSPDEGAIGATSAGGLRIESPPEKRGVVLGLGGVARNKKRSMKRIGSLLLLSILASLPCQPVGAYKPPAPAVGGTYWHIFSSRKLSFSGVHKEKIEEQFDYWFYFHTDGSIWLSHDGFMTEEGISYYGTWFQKKTKISILVDPDFPTADLASYFDYRYFWFLKRIKSRGTLKYTQGVWLLKVKEQISGWAPAPAGVIRSKSSEKGIGTLD